MLLNVDLGELPNEPEELYALADLVNIACGGHAGDEASMRHACELARARHARVGAHPSYEDREHFGRVELALPIDIVAASVKRQCEALRVQADGAGVRIDHLKLHGALYHAANREPELARAVIASARDALGDVAIVGPPSGALSEIARNHGLAFLREGFADRRYLADGSLAPRSQADALITHPQLAAAQALRLADEGRFDTLCVHGDSPDAVNIARVVRRALDERAGR